MATADRLEGSVGFVGNACVEGEGLHGGNAG